MWVYTPDTSKCMVSMEERSDSDEVSFEARMAASEIDTMHFEVSLVYITDL